MKNVHRLLDRVQEVHRVHLAWDYGPSGRTLFWIDGQSGEGLEDGRWSFELTVGGQVVARGAVLRVTTYC